MQTISIPDLVHYHVYTGAALPRVTALLGYDYVMAGNGVFLRCENKHLKATFPVAVTAIAGLPDLSTEFTLKIPEVPNHILVEILTDANSDRTREHMYQIKHNGSEYYWDQPRQGGTLARVEYSIDEDKLSDDTNVVIDLHTHPGKAYFSSIDNHDELGFRLYGVLGQTKKAGFNSIVMRLGVYGQYMCIQPTDVFSEGTNLKEVVYGAYTETVKSAL